MAVASDDVDAGGKESEDKAFSTTDSSSAASGVKTSMTLSALS